MIATGQSRWKVHVLFSLLQIGITHALDPVFSGLSVPVNVNEDVLVQTLLDTFTVTDPDGLTITGCTHTGDSGQFDIHLDTNEIKLYLLAGSNLEHDTTPSFTLVVTCTDAAAESATQNIQVDVLPNQPPAFTLPTSPVTLSENTAVQTSLYSVTVTDAEGNAISCGITATSPTTSNFGIWKSPTDYVVYLLSGATLVYSAITSYDITVQCSDSFGSSTMTLTVDISQNLPPTFNNLPAGSNPSLDASTVTMGTSVYTVTASDSDSTTLTFSLTSQPATPDLFSIDSVTGEITAARDLKYAVDSAYDLTISVTDTAATTTETLQVLLTNVNTAPVIDNLPATVLVSEDTVENSTLFSLTISDPDTGDSANVTYTVNPTLLSGKFSYDASADNLFLGSGQSLDYENWSAYTVLFSVSDGKATSGPYTLTITVTNVNEPCNFSADAYYVTMWEASVGTGSQNPGIAVTDDDVGDSYTLSLVPSTESPYFSLDQTTGVIDFAVNYDVDVTHPTSAMLTVQCTDHYLATSTATLNVTILDVNDNDPVFSQTGYIFPVSQYDAPGSTIATMNATDLDSGVNDDIEYTWVAVTGPSIYHLSTNGKIILTASPTSMSYGDTFRYTVTAQDKGSPPRSGTTVVDIVYTEATTTTSTSTTTTTTPAISSNRFLDEPANIAIVAIGCILGAVAVGLLLYLLLRYCKGKKMTCCKNKPKAEKPPKKKKIQPKPEPKKTAFDFWNDDEFMHRQGKRNVITSTNIPLPAPVA